MEKHVIVTGGAQGIGHNIATDLAKEGYQLTVFDADKEAIGECQKKYANIDFVLADISSEEQLLKAINQVKLIKLYAVINNAAIACNMPLGRLSLEDWNKVLAVNLTAPFLLVKHTAEFLAKNNGCVVNIASTRALMSEADTEAYSASKGGLLSLTHAMAVSLGPAIRVNAISPGWIETRHLKKSSIKEEPLHSEADKLQHPAGRVGKVDDISAMVKFLLSGQAGFITGQNFVIDGGMTRKMIYV